LSCYPLSYHSVLHIYRPTLHLHSFPTRRSSDLDHCSSMRSTTPPSPTTPGEPRTTTPPTPPASTPSPPRSHDRREPPPTSAENGDRKSTRLNSSHQIISYAVFCLKKKIKKKTQK